MQLWIESLLLLIASIRPVPWLSIESQKGSLPKRRSLFTIHSSFYLNSIAYKAYTSAPTSPASFSSASITSCSIKSTLSSSSWLSVLFSFLPSCSLSYYTGVCRSVLRETPLIILLIAGIISHQLIIFAGDVETNPGPIACES